jgi:hypothetical protein
MVSLAQAQAVQKLEANGWVVVEPTGKRAIGGPVMMTRMVGDHVIHTLIMPNGERSGQPPTAAQIRDW